jgi:folate-dependent tRNA-U54 methylase TrmFO/GidA
MHYLRTADPARFQPMNSNFGLLATLPGDPRRKDERRARTVERARREFAAWLDAHELAAASTGAA